MNTDILQDIITHKRIEIQQQEEAIPTDALLERIGIPEPGISLRRNLSMSKTGIIAEFKRKSPSKGWINQNAQSESIPCDYEQAGASGLSILTDYNYFGGSLKDIINARAMVNLPILRKDFVISNYQIYQAKTVGADVILLIAAAITPAECRALARTAHQMNLEVLLEIHSESELDHVNEFIDMIGVNNRNLGTFHTDVDNSFRLSQFLPKELLWISESGLSDPATVKELREVGFKGFLMGETFMKTTNPALALSEFIKQVTI